MAVFPGMDLFLEGYVWEDFHHLLNDQMRIRLTTRVRPKYVVRVEHRVYVEHLTMSSQTSSFLTSQSREESRNKVSPVAWQARLLRQ